MKQDIHQWVEARLSEYLDKRLAPNELTRLETHLQECDRCRASLESLRQTLSLLKQAPVPAPSRQFILPVTQSAPHALRPSFAFLRVATVMATLILCVVVSLDVFTPFRFAAAPAPIQFAAPAAAPTNIALAPTSAPAATLALATAAAVRPTLAQPQSAAQPFALPTATRPSSAGAAESQTTLPSADQTLKSSATTAAAPPAPRAGITNTLASPSPTSSPTVVPSATAPAPTATTQSQARADATPPRVGLAETSQPSAPSLREIEIGLLALVVFLGALTIFVGRRK